MMSGLMGTMVQGMAFGTGSAVAHRAVGAVMGGGGGGHAAGAAAGGGAEAATEQAAAPVCQIELADFQSCLMEKTGDIAACQMFMDAFKQCSEDSQSQQQM